MNAGLGAGALCAAAIVDVQVRELRLDLPGRRGLIRGVHSDAVGSPAGRRETTDVERVAHRAGGYRVIARDRAFLGLWLLTALLVTIGYAQMDSALPVFAHAAGRVTAGGLAVAFAAKHDVATVSSWRSS